MRARVLERDLERALAAVSCAGGRAGTSAARRPCPRRTRRRRGRGVAGRLTVEAHGEADRRARGRRRKDEVEVARLEAVRDRAGGRFEPAASSPTDHSPSSAHWLSASPSRAGRCGARRGRPDVGLRGSHRAPVGGLREPPPRPGRSPRRRPAVAGSRARSPRTPPSPKRWKGPGHRDRRGTRPANTGSRTTARSEVVVDHDRVADAQLGDRTAHVVEVVLEPELGACAPTTTSPRRDSARATRCRTAACAASSRTSTSRVDEHHAAAQPFGGQRLGVQPDRRAVERRERAVAREHGGGQSRAQVPRRQPPGLATRRRSWEACAHDPAGTSGRVRRAGRLDRRSAGARAGRWFCGARPGSGRRRC